MLFAMALAGLALGEARTPRGRIAFARASLPNADIYSIAPDGSHLRQLTSGRAWEASPTWSPDGRSIGYAGQGPSGLYVMRARGGKARRLFRGTVSAPAWSPDGRSIAFGSQAGGAPTIWTISLKGKLHRVTKGFGDHPTWSRDGTRIAYVGLLRGGSAVFTTSRNGTRTRVVSRGPDTPVWSPNGRWIAVRRLNANWAPHEVASLVIVTPRGASPRPLLRGGVIFPVAWSPRSDAVLVLRAANPTSPKQLFIVPLAGGAPRAVPGTVGAVGGASWHR